jgi:hypothetical protein
LDFKILTWDEQSRSLRDLVYDFSGDIGPYKWRRLYCELEAFGLDYKRDERLTILDHVWFRSNIYHRGILSPRGELPNNCKIWDMVALWMDANWKEAWRQYISVRGQYCGFDPELRAIEVLMR